MYDLMFIVTSVLSLLGAELVINTLLDLTRFKGFRTFIVIKVLGSALVGLTIFWNPTVRGYSLISLPILMAHSLLRVVCHCGGLKLVLQDFQFPFE